MVFSLQAFLNQHCASYNIIQRCAEHVQHQLSDTRQGVKWILGNVDCEESDVQAALYSIRMDYAPDGLRNDFNAAVAFLIPT